VTAVAVEINDAGILVAVEGAGRPEPRPPSPGYALLDGERLVVGLEAVRRARLQPRFVHNRFWDQLDTTPLPPPFPEGRTAADLVHAHLSAVGEPLRADSVLLAAPGWLSGAQLGLLLGIARASGMPVDGMVDAAVAAAMGGYDGNTILHVDVQLHRAVVTELKQGRELVRERVEVAEDVGVVALHDAWAKGIAEAFVRQTRFDPLHTAAAEQVLYDRLPDWLAALGVRDTAVAGLEAGGDRHVVELTRAETVGWVDGLYGGIARLLGSVMRAGEPAVVLVSHRASALPGLPSRLGEVQGADIVRLAPGAAAAGALWAREQIAAPGEELPFMTRLTPDRLETPRELSGTAGETLAPLPSKVPARQPTHVLLEGLAHPITAEPFFLGIAIPHAKRGLNLTGRTAGISRSHCRLYRAGDEVVVEDHSTYGSFLNGARVVGRATLAVGDRLRLGSPGIELQLIAVADTDGAPAG
jgi:FHA domain